MIAFLAVLRKEFLQILKDRRMLPLLLVVPIVQLLILGFAVNFDVNNIRAMVCDFDRTPFTRQLAQRLFAEGTFVLVGEADDCTRPEREIFFDRAEMVLMIPPKSTGRLLARESVALQALVDGTNPIVGRYAAQAVRGFVAQASLPLAKPRLNAEPRLLFNPEMKSSLFMVPGVAVLILMVVAMIATSMGIVREREMGTLEQVAVTPIGRFAFLFGKVVPFVIFGLIDIVAVLVLSMVVFEVPIRGSLALYFFGTFLYLLNAVGLGLFVSTISKTQHQALLTGFFIMLPAILLSGILTPITAMPQWLQPLTYINPLRYFGEILRGVMLKGSTLEQLGTPFLALGIIGVTLFALATLRFSKAS